jgi:hypothetical protein
VSDVAITIDDCDSSLLVREKPQVRLVSNGTVSRIQRLPMNAYNSRVTPSQALRIDIFCTAKAQTHHTYNLGSTSTRSSPAITRSIIADTAFFVATMSAP